MDLTREEYDAVSLFLLARIAGTTASPEARPVQDALESVVLEAGVMVEGLLGLTDGASERVREFTQAEAAAGWDVLVAACAPWARHSVFPLAARRPSVDRLLA